MYIAVAGNIGCGKTSLVESLTQHYGWKPYYENINNPYIDDFYKDMECWSFKLQISFLANKVSQLRAMERESVSVIQDRTVYEEAEVFVKNLNNMLLMTQRDYKTYLRVYGLMIENNRKPDLLIYLKGSVDALVEQIRKRGRPYEQNIKREYLQSLNELYDEWIEQGYDGNKLIIEIDHLDYINEDCDFNKVTAMIDSKLASIGMKLFE